MTSVALKKPAKADKFDQQAFDIVTKAVSAIVLDDPFYGYLLLRNELKQDPGIDTACTNGQEIRYSPKFIRSLTLPQVKGLLKHEVMHIAHMHHLRRGTRAPGKWNKAADYVINAHLVEDGATLPPGGLIDKQYIDHHTEHVYSILPDDPDNPDGPNGDQPGDNWNWGGVEDAPGADDESTRTQLEEDCKIDVIQAANAAKMMGKLPAHIERIVDQIKESRMPWRQILARFFRATAKADYSWLRPNRRFLASGIYLPALHSEALGPVVIGVDTSGSVGGPELDSFFACINSILKTTKPEAVHVVYCDADVQNVQVFTQHDYPLTAKKMKPMGGGGTSFEPVFEYVKEKRIKPVALIYLTDMYGSFPDKAPNYPTIWCATSDVKAPFGKTISLK
jgi:predicted metal-dependent peptidase